MHVFVVPVGRPTVQSTTRWSASRRLVGAATTKAVQQSSANQLTYSMSGLLNEDGRLERRCEMSPQQVLAKHIAGVYTTALMTSTGAVIDWNLHRRRLERFVTALMCRQGSGPLWGGRLVSGHTHTPGLLAPCRGMDILNTRTSRPFDPLLTALADKVHRNWRGHRRFSGVKASWQKGAVEGLGR